MQAQHHHRVTLWVEQMLRATFSFPRAHQAEHFALGLCSRHARSQPADYGQEVRTTTAGVRAVKLERNQEFDLIVAAWRECKVRGHYADDCCGCRVDLNLFADDVTCSAKTLLP